ncbi:hypothetical protein M3I01_013105 [Marinomonas sp. RSW2]|uniref:Uncharacterized protein n=1 Tax=Marinomonas maritima TaxID=2940935 RepID=A0ABT5WG79_9GAMM|nr:hypothetical protein [Marinomonas maritima]MDE8603836.1 hypothetical protein [Marinomonas maritima]
MHHVRFQPLCIPLTVRSHLRSSVHLTYKIDGSRLATLSFAGMTVRDARAVNGMLHRRIRGLEKTQYGMRWMIE